MTPQTPEPNSGSQSVKPPSSEQVQKVHRLIWTTQSEELLACWADIAMCYKTLHELAYRKYNETNYYFAIPIIVLSTLTGTLNVGLASYVPSDYTSFAQAGIGAINIFTGILTTLSSYFRFAQLSEAHSNASVGWSKLQRNISIELRIECEFRKDADNFIKMCRQDYDRLLEQSPMIPADIISMFNKKFKKLEGLMVPDICGAELKHTLVHREVIESKLPLEVSALLRDNYGMSSTGPNQNPELEQIQKIRDEIKEEKDLIEFTYKKLNETTSGHPEGEMQEVMTQDGPKWRYVDNRARKSVLHSRPHARSIDSKPPPPPVKIEKQSNQSVKDLIKRFTIVDSQVQIQSPGTPNPVECIVQPVQENTSDVTIKDRIEEIIQSPAHSAPHSEHVVEVKSTESDSDSDVESQVMFYPIGTVSPMKQ